MSNNKDSHKYVSNLNKINFKITDNNKQTKKGIKAFTLIELLAVIIILGVLMLIAIPSVTSYIGDTKKETYIDTAKSIIKGASNIVNSGKLDVNDINTTYYIPSSCVKLESGGDSPFGGSFAPAYVLITFNNNSYNYYWMSRDDKGIGIKLPTIFKKLIPSIIESGVLVTDIQPTIGINGRNVIVEYNEDCSTAKDPVKATDTVTVEEAGVLPSNIVCKPATQLHTTTCNLDRLGCRFKFNKGETITFGTIVNGTPKSGDAFDCDVNYDGIYDKVKERFYYVATEGDKSTLIYSSNIDGRTARYAYDSSNENYHGPRTGATVLPSSSEWKHPGLISPGTRNIVSETGNNITGIGIGPEHTIESFSYGNKVARFLSAQDIKKACGVTVGRYVTNELQNCIWLFEGIGQFDNLTSNSSFGYWLETPFSYLNFAVCNLDGSDISVGLTARAYLDSFTGIRPVITVYTRDIEY